MTVVLSCFPRMPRMGELICPGVKTDVATWYSRGWKRWWLVRSMRNTCAGACLRALAAASPPKPPPTMTIRGVLSGMALDLFRESDIGLPRAELHEFQQNFIPHLCKFV